MYIISSPLDSSDSKLVSVKTVRLLSLREEKFPLLLREPEFRPQSMWLHGTLLPLLTHAAHIFLICEGLTSLST